MPYTKEFREKNKELIKERQKRNMAKYMSNPKNHEKVCKIKQNWYEENKESELARVAQYRIDNPDVELRGHLRRKFGLSLEDYNDMLLKQDGKCKICGLPPRNKTRGKKIARLSVDHDHKTGKVRGLLCHHCNVAIGYIGDSVENLNKAILYLQEASTK